MLLLNIFCDNGTSVVSAARSASSQCSTEKIHVKHYVRLAETLQKGNVSTLIPIRMLRCSAGFSALLLSSEKIREKSENPSTFLLVHQTFLRRKIDDSLKVLLSRLVA